MLKNFPLVLRKKFHDFRQKTYLLTSERSKMKNIKKTRAFGCISIACYLVTYRSNKYDEENIINNFSFFMVYGLRLRSMCSIVYTKYYISIDYST